MFHTREIAFTLGRTNGGISQATPAAWMPLPTDRVKAKETQADLIKEYEAEQTRLVLDRMEKNGIRT